MMRKWTLVSMFAALAVISWAQPSSDTSNTQKMPNARRIEGMVPPAARQAESEENQTPRGRRQNQGEATTGQRRAMRDLKQAVSPAPTPQNAEATPFVPPAMPRGPKDATPAEKELRTPHSTQNDNATPVSGEATDRAKRILRNGENTPAIPNRGKAEQLENPTPTPPHANPTPSPTPQPSPTAQPSPTRTPRPSPTPEPSPSPTPEPTATPKPSPTPAPTPEQTQTPAPLKEELPTPRPAASPAGETPSANATPFVPSEMPGNLRDRRANRPGRQQQGDTPRAGKPTPAAAAATTAAGQNTPPANVTTGATPAAVQLVPGVASTPQTADQRLKQAQERAQRQAERRAQKGEAKAIDASKATSDTLNQAAAVLLNKAPKKERKNPAKVQLTPWIAPVTGGAGAITALPAGATPTPTPAPERIVISKNSKVINNIKNITIVPTPPPAPTPGVTPVPTPPGVTPVPHDWHPPRNWVPYPGWRPQKGWKPPVGWVPPGGWSPPPGWQPPRDWIVRLRGWGWNYIPRRGWVVPVQWTPPPDFVVPPDWYYLPPSAYEDYGLYDPSEVVVLPGQARPDLQVNINVTQVYNPPAPPPPVVLEAPPPPPRPAPALPPPVPEQITQVDNVVEVLSRPRVPSAPRYEGPVLVTGSVHFDYDSYAIQPDSFPTLDAIGQALVEEMPDAIINVEGHTDSDGSDEYNQTLSEQRAWSVKSYIVQKFGLDPNRLIIVGYGERAPIADNNGDAGKARNRRVEFENVTDLYKSQVVETAAPGEQ